MDVWVAAVIVVGIASLQLILSRWRDLGALTIGGFAAALVAVVRDPPGYAERGVVAGLLLLAAALAAAAWARGAAGGVGRTAPNGIALVAGVAAVAIAWLIPAEIHGVGLDRAAVALVAPCLVVAAMASVASLDRPGARPTCPKWYRTVPIE